MPRSPLAKEILACTTAVAVLLCARNALAKPPEGTDESAEDRRAAARLFNEGQKAFNSGDFQHAAEAFEQAYRQAPRPAPLWNAARAWHRAGEPVKAANLYASYLKVAPPGASDRASALAAMKELEPKVARIEVHAEGFTDLTLDGAKLESTTVYVSPGSHRVEGKRGGKTALDRPKVEAGGLVSVTLVEPRDEPPPPPPPPPAEPPPPRGLSPAYAAVGAGLVAVGTGVTVWSGLDTLHQKKTFDALPTQQNLDDGKSRQSRTNTILLVTGGVALATAAVALFFTDWGGQHEGASIGVGPRGVTVQGAF